MLFLVDVNLFEYGAPSPHAYAHCIVAADDKELVLKEFLHCDTEDVIARILSNTTMISKSIHKSDVFIQLKDTLEELYPESGSPDGEEESELYKDFLQANEERILTILKGCTESTQEGPCITITEVGPKSKLF